MQIENFKNIKTINFSLFRDFLYKDELPNKNDKKFCFDSLVAPGFYGIYSSKTKRTYLSHSRNVLLSMMKTYEDMVHHRFEDAFDLLGEFGENQKDLSFFILDLGQEWEDFNERQKQLERIKTLWPYELYKQTY
jgi:hypothetical protein